MFFSLQNFYFVTIFDIFLIFSFLIGYYIPSVVKISKREKKFETKDLNDLKIRMGIDADVYVIPPRNMSMNAFQIGARGKYVFLSSNLFESLSDMEILAVIAHEFSHIKLRHVLKNLIIVYLILAVGINLLLISISTLLSSIIIISIVPLALLFNTLLKKKFDYEADSYAIKFVNSEYLVSALTKINAAIYPSFIVEKGKMHPLIKKRIEMLKNVR